MVWLYILLALCAFLALILFSPIGLTVEYKEQFKIKVKLMGIPFSVPIGKNKNEKATPPSSKKEKSKSKKDILKSIGNIGKILKASKEAIVSVAKNIKINTLKLVLYVGAEDAAETAIKYGQASAVIYPTLSVINTLSKPQKILVNIIPNFPSEKINVDFKINLKSSIFNLVVLAITLFKKYKEII